MPSPFKLDQALPITRGTDGRFREFSRDVPPNPLEEAEAGAQPREWAPGVGQSTAPITGQAVPWPGVAHPRSFRVG